MIEKKDGFTSIELMVAIAVLFIIIAFVYSAYFFTLKIYKVWNEKLSCERTAMICMNSLTEDIIHATEILRLNENTLVLLNDDTRMIVYRTKNDNLYRNRFCVNPPEVKIYDLSFSFIENKAFSKQPRMIKIKFTVGSLRTHFTIQSSASPRNLEKSFFEVSL